MNKSVLLAMFLALLPTAASLADAADTAPAQATVYTYRASESEGDVRYSYDYRLLKLALDKTVADYGPYELRPSAPMNFLRALTELRRNQYPNFVMKQSYTETAGTPEEFEFIEIPVDRGIVGYRVCFTSKGNVDALQKTESLEALQQFSIGQGVGWVDNTILEHNGFRVVEVPIYESLFTMVASRRFDLLCRGANEVLYEWKAHQDIPNFTLDEHILIYYPLPRFFSYHRANRAVMQRIHEGLRRAYADGSFVALWEQFYQESIDFAQLDTRRRFILENPLLGELSPDYQQYLLESIPR